MAVGNRLIGGSRGRVRVNIWVGVRVRLRITSALGPRCDFPSLVTPVSAACAPEQFEGWNTTKSPALAPCNLTAVASPARPVVIDKVGRSTTSKITLGTTLKTASSPDPLARHRWYTPTVRSVRAFIWTILTSAGISTSPVLT